jgi:uncharacterized membrane protein
MGEGSLTVCTFATASGAEAELPHVQQMVADGLAVDDAALVSWPDGRRTPATRVLGCLDGPGALWDGFWGVLLGLIFLVPVAGPSFGAAAGAFAGGLADFGVDEDLVRDVREQVTPGHSALFVLCGNGAADALAAAFADLEVRSIRSRLTHEQRVRLQEALGEESELHAAG